ncbi:TPA: conjugal transfer protein TrbB, partial [Campylobacter fetus subsp. venerealis]|nr:conjugal transfer protein TrbB [Campylobacter fetus subsp. venerealis]
MTEFQERIITKIRREFGNEILDIFNDDKTIEIMLNSDAKLWIEKLDS